jgi:hypothetical protein
MRTDFLVYTHARPDTKEIFYVGKGTCKRIRSKANRNNYWHNIVNKSKGFDSKILAGNLTEEEALNFEVLIISKMKQAGFNLCNLTNGGDGVSGYKRTVESRLAQSKRQKGKPSKNKGIPLTEEHKQKLRVAKLGKKQSPEHIAKAVAARKGRKYSEEHRKAISKALTGKKIPREIVLKNCKPVLCLTNNIRYESVSQAAEQLNLHSSNISRCCKGVFKQTMGYSFEYATSPAKE